LALAKSAESEAVFGGRETAILYCLVIGGKAGADIMAFGGLMAHKARRFAGGDAEHIVHHQNLTITLRPGTNTNYRQMNGVAQLGGDIARHAFQ
jgi:hypothetical protein